MTDHNDEEDPRVVEELLKDAHNDLDGYEESFLSLYKSTDVNIERYSENTRLVLTFEGFSTVEDALDRVQEVVLGLTQYYDDVDATVHSAGMYDPDEGEKNGRPSATVTATFEPDE